MSVGMGPAVAMTLISAARTAPAPINPLKQAAATSAIGFNHLLMTSSQFL
jgi:hypothetical protein